MGHSPFMDCSCERILHILQVLTISSGYGGLAEKRLMACMAASGGYTGGGTLAEGAAAAVAAGAEEELEVWEASCWRLRAAALSECSLKCRSLQHTGSMFFLKICLLVNPSKLNFNHPLTKSIS